MSILNHFKPSGLFYLKSWDKSISYIRAVWFLLLPRFIEASELNANSVDQSDASFCGV